MQMFGQIRNISYWLVKGLIMKANNDGLCKRRVIFPEDRFLNIFPQNRKGFPLLVSGVPPDLFSETGQLWGRF